MSDERWKKIDVVFKLKSPLHAGYMPFKGSVVSPTRYYVPGRNFWGAITKKIAEYMYDNPNAKDYRDIGKLVMENFRFSYFYIFDGKTTYFPHYTEGGLKYGDKTKEINKSQFEHRFSGSRISTAIDSNGAAKDESLHEIEFINKRFKDKSGRRDTKIVGCIWVKKDAWIGGMNVIVNDEGILINSFNVIEELILGGESKYGFGHVSLDSINKVEFIIEVKGNEDKLKVEIEKDKPLLAHFKYHKNIKFKGEIELLSGRGYYNPEKLKTDNNTKASNKPGEIISQPEYYFSPGTVLMKMENITGILDWDGTIKMNLNEND